MIPVNDTLLDEFIAESNGMLGLAEATRPGELDNYKAFLETDVQTIQPSDLVTLATQISKLDGGGDIDYGDPAGESDIAVAMSYFDSPAWVPFEFYNYLAWRAPLTGINERSARVMWLYKMMSEPYLTQPNSFLLTFYGQTKVDWEDRFVTP